MQHVAADSVDAEERRKIATQLKCHNGIRPRIRFVISRESLRERQRARCCRSLPTERQCGSDGRVEAATVHPQNPPRKWKLISGAKLCFTPGIHDQRALPACISIGRERIAIENVEIAGRISLEDVVRRQRSQRAKILRSPSKCLRLSRRIHRS
jgi:hypothetical protein